MAAGDLNKQGGEFPALLLFLVEIKMMKTQKILILKIAFVLMSYLSVIFGAQQAKAQPPFFHQNKSILRMDGQDTYFNSSGLDLTQAQKKTFERLQRNYMSEVLPPRMELAFLRFELHHLVRDPSAQSKLLFDRQRKISELQAKLDNLLLSYQIKARSIFTKEQLQQLPLDFSMSIETGFGTDIGIGRRVRKNTR